MTDITPHLQAYHALYVKLTRSYDVKWDAGRMFPWERFAHRFTLDDLKLVIRHLHELKRYGRNVRSFNFRTFIAGPESIAFMEEDLAEAKALNRHHKEPDRDSVLRATGRQPEPNSTTRTAAQVLAGDNALKQLLAVRDSL